MQQFSQFIMHHWELCFAFVILLTLIIRLELRTHYRGVGIYLPQQCVFLINQQNARIFDLRPQQNFTQGHILDSIAATFEAAEKTIQQKVKDQSQPIILVGANDQQALKIGVKLKQLGYEQVGILKGGIHNWLSANLPVKKGTE